MLIIVALLILCAGWFGYGWWLMGEGERIAKIYPCTSGGLGSSMIGFLCFCLPAALVAIILGVLLMLL